MATRNRYHGSGLQNNYNARDQNINYGRDQIVEVINVGRDLVRNFDTTVSSPHKSLWDAVGGVGASHTAEQQFERGECLEGTRVVVQRNIHEWRTAKKKSLPICWLCGTAGVGKTAIAMSIAKAYEKKGLVASFFFFRSDPKRNNPSALVPTIAHGLVINMPFAGSRINQRISDDPKILEATLEDQFRELVLKPSGSWWRRLAKLVLPAAKEPDLIIIDGLDECSDEQTQRRILSIILSSYRQLPHFPLRFLICSRPEAWIQEAFASQDLSCITECIVLDDTFVPDKDIERYYLHEFQAIRTDPKYSRVQFPTPWPSTEDLGALVQKASSQFVYAATAVRSIKNSHPITQLRQILDYTPGNSSFESSSFNSTLDELYHMILSLSTSNHDRLLSILAAVLILPPHAPPSPDFIELLLEIPPGEVDLTLRSMHSVLEIRDGNTPIGVYHTSFTDFLYDPLRSKQFYIDRAACHDVFAQPWLRILTRQVQGSPNVVSDANPFDLAPNLQRLLKAWVHFCLADNQPTVEVVEERGDFLQSFLSTLPEQQKLTTILATIILLPVESEQSQILQALGLDPGAYSLMKSLRACQLATSSPMRGIVLRPFLIDLLSNPLQRYYIDRQKYQNYLARLWVQALVLNQPASERFVAYSYNHLQDRWADLCCGIEHPSSELLSDLQHLDLSRIATGAINKAILCRRTLSVAARPFEVVTSWLTSRDPPVPTTLTRQFSEALTWFRHSHRDGSKKGNFRRSSHDSERDCLYEALISANSRSERTRLVLIAILILPKYLKQTPANIGLVLGLPPEQVTSTVQTMHSVLAFGDRKVDAPVFIHDVSFKNYLVDRRRSLAFHIDIIFEKSAIARLWLQNLSTNKIQTYSFNQLLGDTTIGFFTKWIKFYISEFPACYLLDGLRNVDLASVFFSFAIRNTNAPYALSWGRYFKELTTHLSQHCNGNHDLDDLLLKLRRPPQCFHLEWQPNVSPQDETVHWVVRVLAGCQWGKLPPSSDAHRLPRITECDCDLHDGGAESHNPQHLAFQTACLQVATNFVSRFKKLVKSRSSDEGTELLYTFLDLVNSSLLMCCRLDASLFSLCRTFFKVAKGFSELRSYPSESGERDRTNLLEWIETFPDRYAGEAEALKAQVLALPWKKWSRPRD
ncbi:hypothetical protein PQX77_002200 [Marasmius sp. AFHP31]|nr:hypothetical protein PQX77_002200 [Marasmius sp. AFHP31]